MWIVFDVDGVLIDTRKSYDMAVKMTAERFLRSLGIEVEIEAGWIAELRSHGIFANDFDVAEALIILSLHGSLPREIQRIPEGANVNWLRRKYGAAINPQEIVKFFNTLYFGEDSSSENSGGLWRFETPLVDTETLIKLDREFSIGVVTGRNRVEMRMAEKLLGFEFRSMVTREMYAKPDPRALWHITDGDMGIYIGDSLVDELLVQNYRKSYGEFLYLQVGRDASSTMDAIELARKLLVREH